MSGFCMQPPPRVVLGLSTVRPTIYGVGHAADLFLPRTLANRLRRTGFRVEARQVIPLLNAAYDPNTYSNRLVDIIVPFVAGRNEITREDAEMWAKELRQLGEQGEYFFSLNRYLFLAKKP
jgi:arsenite methyltransferase